MLLYTCMHVLVHSTGVPCYHSSNLKAVDGSQISGHSAGKTSSGQACALQAPLQGPLQATPNCRSLRSFTRNVADKGRPRRLRTCEDGREGIAVLAAALVGLEGEAIRREGGGANGARNGNRHGLRVAAPSGLQHAPPKPNDQVRLALPAAISIGGWMRCELWEWSIGLLQGGGKVGVQQHSAHPLRCWPGAWKCDPLPALGDCSHGGAFP
jgi:hypothetical protein